MRALSSLSDSALLATTRRLARAEASATAELVAHLAEVDARKLYAVEACPSLFVYVVERLRLSEDAAYKRIQVTRLSRRLPVVLDYLAGGRIHLSGLNLLAPVLTEENHLELLERAAGRSKREIEALVAELAESPPVPPPRAQIRKLPVRRPPAAPAREIARDLLAEVAPPSSPAPAQVPAPPAEERYAISFVASRRQKDLLDRASELLAFEVPRGDVGAIVERGLALLVADLEKKRFGKTALPRRRKVAQVKRSRRIPNAVKREVHERDGGQCTYVDAKGRRCPERGALEFDHELPHALGGPATVANVRLRCRIHNQLAAEERFGREFMERKRAERRAETPPRPTPG